MRKVIFLFLLIFCVGFISCTIEDDDPVNGSDDSDVSGGDESVDLPDGDSTGQADDDNGSKPDDVADVPDEDSNVPDDDAGPNKNLQDVSNAFASNTVDTITLNWKNPEMEGFQYVVITHRMDRYPENKDDGTVIYQGSDETKEMKSVQMGEPYFFTIYSCYGAQGCSKGVNIYTIPCYNHLDIVFSMDVSTTMGFILADLENEIGLVWEFVEGKFSAPPRIGLTVFVDDVTVTNGGEAFDSQAALKSEFNKWYKHTLTNKQTQSSLNNGDWPENSLDSLAYSARDFKWRDPSDTLRIIIHATDDTFYEYSKKFSNGIAVEYTYDGTVELLVQERIRVAAFAAKLGGFTGNANVEPGFFTSYNGKPSIPDATGGDVYLINDVKDGKIHLYQSVNDFIENAMCKSYGQK